MVSSESNRLRVPDSDAPDALLEAFLTWTAEREFELYPAQEEAVLEIFDGRHVVLNTPTGSGKSLVAVAAHLRSLARGRSSYYTSPIKALVSEKFFGLCEIFGAQQVGMLTGDGAVNADAPILCCTAEVLANHALLHGEGAAVDSVVMDEFHYYADPSRGTAWQIPLLILEQTTFLLMSATLGDTRAIEERLEEQTGVAVASVKSAHRPVPLDFDYVESPLLETLAALVRKGKSPVYVVAFRQRDASELAQNLTSTALIDREQRGVIREEIKGFRFDSPYGKAVRRFLEAGVGVHHAGLLPRYRLLVERLAQRGLLVVICGTDTLGVGVNVPIRTVLFTRLYKFDGERRRVLSVREFKQIAGRAGRKGFDDRGHVVCQAPAHRIENKRLEAKVAGGLLSKKKFRRQAPPKDFVPYDRDTFERLVQGDPEALESVFSIDHGMLLHLMQRDPADCGLRGGYGLLLELIERSHARPTDKAQLGKHAGVLLSSLIEAGLVESENPDAPLEGDLRLSEALQDDFSVFNSLALYLLAAVDSLELDDEEYALRVITAAEAIQENPRPVLYAQRSREKGIRIAELKAEGMDYHDRMQALEEVTWPKPDADWIYGTFNTYVESRPWLSAEYIRPKSVVREFVELWTTFHEYVRELKLATAEGVLLRYLSQVYKVLARSIPEHRQTEELVGAIAFLRATIAHADSSLVREWEKLLEPAPALELAEDRRPLDISRDGRSFTARVRAEMHLLLHALARRDYEEATAHVRSSDPPWDVEAFERAMAPFFDRFSRLRTDHEARLADKTLLRAQGDHLWRVSHLLLDPEGEGMWSIEGRVDLRGDTNPDGPLVELLGIEG
jgi:superfamily II RNA helicase